MSISRLLLYSLTFIPFITAINISPLFPVITDDPRFAREFLCLSVAIGIIVIAIRDGLSITTKNKWFLGLLFYIVFGIGYSPKFYLEYNNFAGNVAGFWMYDAMVRALLYAFVFLVISNYEFKREDVLRIFRWVSAAGFVMSIYVILQHFELDQFAVLRKFPDGWGGDSVDWHTAAALTGTLGNPTIVSAWLVPIVPVAFFSSRKIFAFFMIVAVALTRSQMAIFAMCMILIAAFTFFVKRVSWLSRASVLLNVFLIAGFLLVHFNLINDNNRFNTWKDLLRDWKGGVITQPIPEDWPQIAKDITEAQNKRKYPITGVGIGSFRYVFTQKHKVPWIHAHNEPLELGLYNMGIVGSLIIFMVVFVFMRQSFAFCQNDNLYMGLFLSTAAYICLALGNFVLQIEPHRLTFVIFAALLVNKNWIEKRGY